MQEFKKEGFISFLKEVKKRYELVAPIKEDGIVKYSHVKHPEEIILEQPNFSLKKYVLAQKEEIFEFKGKNINYPKQKERNKAFFAPKCDIAMFGPIDKIYLKGPIDKNYAKKRKKYLLIEFVCKNTGKNCFCDTMELGDYHDILITEINGNLFAEAKTKIGKKLLNKHLDHTHAAIHYRMPVCEKTKKDLKNVDYKQAERCLACGACTMMCPTCNCFDMIDSLKLDINDGKREKVWDSCQYQDFTRVAGGAVFRDTKEKRLYHRLHHKIDWFKEKNHIYMCTGCGRCITNCPADITFIEKKRKK